MPHQRMIADVGGEIIPETGLPAYREVIFTWPRQTGKTVLVLGFETERCTIWEERQRVLYTAQTGTDARDKLLEDQVPILEAKMPRYLRRVYRAKGEEAVSFRNGSRIQLAASSEKSGHGATIDLGVIDECWADEDNRREQTILPMIKTRPHAQILVCSTQGTDKSSYLNRKTELGRAAAAADKGHGVAYFEFSVPEDADIENPDIWWQYMPGLGYTITEEAIAHDLATMDEAEFRRADCNQRTTAANERIIPESLWGAVQDGRADIDRAGRISFAIDVHPERGSAAIAVSDGRVIGLIEHHEGTGWVRARVLSLREKWGGTFALDANGPAGSLIGDLEKDGIPLVKLSNAEVVAACGRMYDSIADGQIKVRPSESLDAAVMGLAKRPVGDRFVWSRQASSTDITPFVAATLALSATLEKEVVPLAAWT